MKIHFRKRRTKLKVVVLQGGNGLSIAPYATRLYPGAVVIAIDVDEEIDRLKQTGRVSHVRVFVLAPGKTAASL